MLRCEFNSKIMNRLTYELSIAVWKPKSGVAKFSRLSVLYNKSNVNRQGKILSKLFGNRVSGSKKRWYESPMPISREALAAVNSPFNLNPKKTDHGTSRRTTVLNKLFMSHITDLLATGEASQKILGRGLQITRVKVTQNFQICNVYWTGKSNAIEPELEKDLQECGGRLRHELSQLRLMGQVPRIHFVKDKTFVNLTEVEDVLKSCDFGEGHKEMDPSLQIKNELFHISPDTRKTVDTKDDPNEDPLPEMRHDVFGVDHRAIMLRIMAKLKKSEKAWQQYEEGEQGEENATQNMAVSKFDQMEEKSLESKEDDSFNKFLKTLSRSKRFKEKKFRKTDDESYRGVAEDEYDPLEDNDFIEEEYDEHKK